ncbi:hypothetical protein BCR35DRAFT_310415 [Leucosporidium creatinivorum]|uniref:Armadillo-type protein n=1 Tax=Leucosporidium creatinivorum TaxID=106004 RepID=A0A1Y2D4R5_9BASI|nr:hypothetical protein BCR35DRAFT_310415 [Leucosporidium creatinivorum]
MLSLQWCLPTAVNLAAGGGGSGSSELRRIGYRACDEIFTTAPHSLKLLLINTIRSDLYAASSPARWILGLRAAASPRLATTELVPAVAERAWEILQAGDLPPHIRRLALAALLNLLAIPSTTHETLLPALQATVLSLLSPPPSAPSSSSSRSTSSHRRKRPLEPIYDPTLLSALLSSLSSPSSLLPLSPSLASPSALIQIHLDLLTRIAGSEWSAKKWEFEGVKCGWFAGKISQGLKELVEGLGEGEEGSRKRVAEAVGEWIEKMDLVQKAESGESGSAGALLLLAVSLLSPLPATVSPLLTSFAHQLKYPHSPKRFLLGLKGLRAVDPALWTGKEKGEGRESVWGESTWMTVLGGLENRDEGVRKETILLLLRVDASLVELHNTRLLNSLRSLIPNPSAGGSTSHLATSTTSTSSSLPRLTSHQHRKQQEHLLRLLLEASSVADADSGTAWAKRLCSIIDACSDGSSSRSNVLPLIITSTIDRFTSPSAPSEVRSDVARAMWDEGGWRGEVMKGLIVAGTLEVGNEEERLKRATMVGEWLLGGERGGEASTLASPPPPHPLLIPPFLLALLRLLSLLPPSALSTLSASLSGIVTAENLRSPETEQLLEIVERFVKEEAEDGEEEVIAALRRASASGRDGEGRKTLVEWWETVQLSLKALRPPAAASQASPPSSPPPRRSTDRPLRYSSYSSTSTSPPTRSSERKDDRESKPFDPALRERIALGGRGGVGESLLGEGALERVRGEEGLEWRDGEKESDGEEEAEDGKTPMQRSVEKEDAPSSRARERETSGSSSEGGLGGESRSPPADLLIELEAVNPFHDAM